MVQHYNQEITLARWAFYDFFSKIFYQPEEDMLDETFARLIWEANQKYPAVDDRKVSEFCDLLETIEDTQELLVEYSKMFVGPSKLTAPPYGSYYLDKGQVMGKSTMAVKDCYGEAGFRVLDQVKEPPDHIAIEMNFLAQLTEREYQYLESGDQDQATRVLNMAGAFYLRHPANWVKEFAQKILDGTHHQFYAYGATFLLGFHHREIDFYQAALAGKKST